jgi:hypothetical protein
MALRLALALLLAVPQAGDDPLTGTWEGRGTGTSEMIPPEGFAFTLALETQGPEAARATLTIEGLPTTRAAEAEFDPDTDELSFTCDLSGIRVALELELDGEELAGTATGLGLEAQLRARRTSRTLLHRSRRRRRGRRATSGR